MICPNCGRENPEGFAFCGHCGAALTSQPAPRKVRKTVTILFADVVGSTAAGELRDPERVRAEMGRWFEQARATIERHGGTVEKFAGDAVMAVFGVPVAREDDALRAVRAAEELRAPQLRIGVNTGEVVTGKGETLATGDAVNVAARLEQSAGAGEILIGVQTHQLTRDAVDAEAVDPLELKGKSAAVAAYRLRGVRAGADAIARHLDAPLVGRRRELDRLKQSFADACAGSTCQLFTLLGTAGVGKSRLAAEFLAGVDARVVRGRCLSYGEGITYFPVVEVLMQLGVDAESVLGSTPGETQLAFRKVLEREAAEQPLVAVFDDIQWGEPAFLDLIEHLADLSRGAPILLLCIARPELLDVRPTWGGGKLNATTILLEPLSESECAELIAELGGADGDLHAKVVEASQGNPLFVEEMLTMVREGGDVAVPPTIHALLQARLDALAREERFVVERAAVEGEVFHRSAVVELVPDADVDAQLPSLVRKELIRPATPVLEADDAYRFRHLLIRDAAYASLPKETRADLHERFASWLDTHARLVEQDEIVGYHLEQAALYRRELGGRDENVERAAAKRLGTAGRAARDRGDVSAAINLLERAARLAPDSSHRAEYLLDAVPSLLNAGRFDVVRAALEEIGRSDDARTQARGALADITFSAYATGKIELAATRERIARARATLTRCGSDEDLAYASWVAADVEWFALEMAAMRLQLEETIRLARKAGTRWLETAALGRLTRALSAGPAPLSEAERELEQIRTRAAGHPVLNAVTSALGECALFRGDFERARELIESAIAGFDEVGQSLQAAAARALLLGHVEELRGDYAAAAQTYRKGYEALTARDEHGHASSAAMFTADALVELGRDDEARWYLDETRRLTSPGDLLNVIGLGVIEGRLRAQQGDRAGAVELTEGALQQASGADMYAYRAWMLETAAKSLIECDRPERAREVLEQLIALSEAKEATVHVERARKLLAQL